MPTDVDDTLCWTRSNDRSLIITEGNTRTDRNTRTRPAAARSALTNDTLERKRTLVDIRLRESPPPDSPASPAAGNQKAAWLPDWQDGVLFVYCSSRSGPQQAGRLRRPTKRSSCFG